MRLVIITLAILLLGVIGWFLWAPHNSTSGGQTQKYTTFDGKVTGINNGCAYDDTCTVTVDDKIIVTGGGLSSDPNANVYGTKDADLAIGDKVSVKALSAEHGLTLQGCQECYISRGSIRRY